MVNFSLSKMSAYSVRSQPLPPDICDSTSFDVSTSVMTQLVHLIAIEQLPIKILCSQWTGLQSSKSPALKDPCTFCQVASTQHHPKCHVIDVSTSGKQQLVDCSPVNPALKTLSMHVQPACSYFLLISPLQHRLMLAQRIGMTQVSNVLHQRQI